MLSDLKQILKICGIFPSENSSFSLKFLRASEIVFVSVILFGFCSAAIAYSIKYQKTVEIVKAAGYTYNVVAVNLCIYLCSLWNRKSLKRAIDLWEDLIEKSTYNSLIHLTFFQ